MKGLTRRNETMKASLASVEAELETAVAERNLSLFQGARMRRQVASLEHRLETLQEAEQEVGDPADREDRCIDRPVRTGRRTRRPQARRGSDPGQGSGAQPGRSLHQARRRRWRGHAGGIPEDGSLQSRQPASPPGADAGGGAAPAADTAARQLFHYQRIREAARSHHPEMGHALRPRHGGHPTGPPSM